MPIAAYRMLLFVAVLMFLGSGAASAATVPWSPLTPRVAPNVWARTPSASLSPASISASSTSGQAPEAILYAFKGMPDGQNPAGGLIADEYGSLYGTTQNGGLVFPPGNPFGNEGTVFKLTPTGSGGYAESVIYRFGASGPNDGYYPWEGGSLAIDRMGALYGFTDWGGAFAASCGGVGCGTIYKLTPTAHGYAESILYSFQGLTDGGQPVTTPILSRSGALYGTAISGGIGQGNGVVYKLTPTGSGYKFSVLYAFGASGPNDGSQPYGPVMLDERTGDVYGTTEFGGIDADGIVFKLHPTASGYVETILYSFHGPDGALPLAGLIMDSAGALYGTTVQGSPPSSICVFTSRCGVAFKLTPSRGGYTESVLHYFTGGADGGCPGSPLVADRFGSLYSTASCGGAISDGGDGGTVFKLVPTRTGYQEVTLHEFSNQTDGLQYYQPALGVLLKGDYLLGEIYGAGGSNPDINGAIYALKIPCDKR